MIGRRTLAQVVLALLMPLLAGGAQGGAIRGTVAVPNAKITGVVVYLTPVAASNIPAVRPETAAMDQHDLRFVPRVIAVTPGSTVVFSNSDRVMHNVFHPGQRSNGFDLGLYGPGESRSSTFVAEGAYVILCQVHPEMVAYVVVIASPYRAVTDAQGQFHLEGLAPGTYRLRTWHHRLVRHEQMVSVTEGGSVVIDMSLRYGHAEEPTAHP